METRLAGNIRRFRKERALTQEQLAEVLGVTTGAVYKWEAGLSIPELDLIVEMADFFDVSVDVLLGYEMRDNRLEATVRRLRDLRRNKDRAGLSEAEKAVMKYPHSFRIVNECAAMYRAFGYETGDKAMYRRALELLDKARLLLAQNEDPEISEQTLYGKMAEVYLGLDETDKAIELLKEHNAGGLYNNRIGHVLAVCERFDEAVPYLSESMMKLIAELINIAMGYLNVYLFRGDHASAEAILEWAVGLFEGLRKENKPNLLDKVSCAMLGPLAFAKLKTGRKDEARDVLIKAKELAEFFDAAPSYDEEDIRFITRIEGASAHDDIGATAMEAAENGVINCESEELTALWNTIKGGNYDKI